MRRDCVHENDSRGTRHGTPHHRARDADRDAVTFTPLHVAAGLCAIGAGGVALLARKGDRLHRKSGLLFVGSMLVMAVSGATLAALKVDWGTALGGLVSAYMVITGLRTVRPRTAGSHRLDLVVMLMGLSLAVVYMTFGLQALSSSTGKRFGYSPTLYFVFGSVTSLAVLGDLRMLRAGGVQGASRLARHLWRMCFALFVAVASLFLGQQQVFPQAIRKSGLLAVPVLLVLLLMVYWLVRVRLRRRSPAQAERPVAAV